MKDDWATFLERAIEGPQRAPEGWLTVKQIAEQKLHVSDQRARKIVKAQVGKTLDRQRFRTGNGQGNSVWHYRPIAKKK